MTKNWKLSPANEELRGLFVEKLDIHPITAQLLINRGLDDCDKATAFINPDIKNIHDPFLMKDMDLAVKRIKEAIDRSEKIAIYGDYDVDGITGSSLLKLFLAEVGVEAVNYLPERLSEGYGLNIAAMEKLASGGAKLLITTDCGISNSEEVAHAATLGLDVIITDHHEPPKTLPSAVAVLNPRREDCSYPFKGLAGVGVTFKLVVALRGYLRDQGYFTDALPEPNLKRYLDILAIGTVADMVPLLDENRVLVKFGIEELKNTAWEGLKALKSVAGVRDERLNTESISYQLAPRINAAGRIGKAETALELITTDDPTRASQIAYDLDTANRERQKVERAIFNEALEMVDSSDPEDMAIVLYKEGWHPGVIGIVASRLSSRFTKPALLIAVDGDVGRGSARGVRNFNILEGLSDCSDYLEKFGGHKAAAGLTIKTEKIEGFKKSFLSNTKETLSDKDLLPVVDLDAIVSLDEIDHKLVSEIERLSPFGISNREPLLCAMDADIVHSEVVGTRHLRLKVRHKGKPLRAIGFGLGDLHPLKGPGFDLAFRPYFDDWNGMRNLNLKVKDVKESST